MNLLPELENYEQRCREELRMTPELEAVLRELDAVDEAAQIARLTEEFIKSFRLFADPAYTGNHRQLPVKTVLFEFNDASDDPWVYAYGSSRCEGAPDQVEDEIFGGVDAFSDTGGFDADPYYALSGRARDEGDNEAGQVVLARLARVCHHALARAVKDPAFGAVPKKFPLYFLVGEHDMGAIIAYEVDADPAAKR